MLISASLFDKYIFEQMCFQLSFEDCHTPSCPNISWERIHSFGAQALNDLSPKVFMLVVGWQSKFLDVNLSVGKYRCSKTLLTLLLSNLGQYLIITFFHGFRVAHVLWKYLDVVSARFTASSIFCEMAAGLKSPLYPKIDVSPWSYFLYLMVGVEGSF